MDQVVSMEIAHSSSNVSRKRKPEIPVEQYVIIQEHVIQTALGTVFCDDGHVGVRVENRGTDELTEVRVVHVSAWWV